MAISQPPITAAVASAVKSFIGLSWIVRVISSDKHTIAFLAFASIPHPSHLSLGLYPPIELEAHPQVPRHDPVAFNPGDERVEPVQQQFSYRRFFQLIKLIKKHHLRKIFLLPNPYQSRHQIFSWNPCEYRLLEFRRSNYH